MGDVLLLKLRQQWRESNNDFTRVWKWFHFQQETKVTKVTNFKPGNMMCVLTKGRLHHCYSLNGHALTEEKDRMITTHSDSVLLELNSSQQIILQWFLAEINTKMGEEQRVIRTISK
jgi:hypothetical protein